MGRATVTDLGGASFAGIGFPAASEAAVQNSLGGLLAGVTALERRGHLALAAQETGLQYPVDASLALLGGFRGADAVL